MAGVLKRTFSSRKKSSGIDASRSKSEDARRKIIRGKGMMSTLFLDPETMRALNLHECTQQLFIKGGLGGFYHLRAPTFPAWTIEFIASFENHCDEERISFSLGGSRHSMSYEDIDTALGITKRPSSPAEWDEAQDYYTFWYHSTRTRNYDPQAGEYNYKWSHPGLRLAHKVVRMAFHGQSEINKVPYPDLYAIWSMTPECPLVWDWRAQFLACCKRFQLDKPHKIVIGGMVSLIGTHLGLELPDPSQQFSPQYTYDWRQLRTSSVVAGSGTSLRWLFGTRGCYWFSIPFQFEMPFGPRYRDFDVSHFRVGGGGAAAAGPSAAPLAQPAEDEDDDEDTVMPEVQAPAAAGPSIDYQRDIWEMVQGIDSRQRSMQSDFAAHQQEFVAHRHSISDFRQEFVDFREEARGYHREFVDFRQESRDHYATQAQDIQALEEQMRQWNAFMGSQYPGFPPPQQ